MHADERPGVDIHRAHGPGLASADNTRSDCRSVSPTTQEIFDCPLAVAPWLPSAPVLDLAVAVLPVITDDTAADLITELTLTIVDQREELRAVRTVLSVALAKLAADGHEKLQLRARVCALLDERRAR
jgi:hypothetical protein